MTAAHSEYRLRRRVQFHEVDGAGIVHFSCFFRYMEEAEHALWRQAGLSISPPGAEIAFPRISATFEFHKPLRFEDEFDVHLRVTDIAEKTVRYGCEILLGSTRIATGTLGIICVSHKPGEPMKAIPIPPVIASRLAVAAVQGG